MLGVRLCHPDDGAQGRLTLLEAEPLCVSVGVAALKKAGGERLRRPRHVLQDGRRGCCASSSPTGWARERTRAGGSVEAVGILERFLRGGVEPDVAMKILNGALLLKNEDEWGFATVDLMCVDLFSGEAGFYKYGAAPSYVRSGKSVRRIDCESLAAGMAPGEGAAPDAVHMVLRPGRRGRHSLRRRGRLRGRRLAARADRRERGHGYEGARPPRPAQGRGAVRQGRRHDRPRPARGRQAMSGPGLKRRAVVRGTARRVVIVPPPEGSVFEQAIFVLRPGAERRAVTPDELLREAMEAAGLPERRPRRRSPPGWLLAAASALAVLLAAAVCALL